MIKLFAWITLPNGRNILAGELITANPDPDGAISGQFRYSHSYLGNTGSFSLDPFHLPLNARIFDANRPKAGVHGVFEDSLPDDWGRRLLIRKYRLSRTEQRVPHLLKLLGGSGLGALKYFQSASSPRANNDQTHDLEKLISLARQFEENRALADEDLAILFQAGSSPGGARPKAIITDNGVPSIAKFPSIKDQIDVVGLEAAAMSLARMAGLKVPKTRLLQLGERKALLVERFDVTPGGGRLHMVSMQTLLGAEGYYNLGYHDLAGIIRQISDQPASDLKSLYRQMVFNALIGNTDDHLKNFLMLHGDEGWHLSPAFDLVPNIGLNREHILHIGDSFLAPTKTVLLSEAKKYGLSRQSKGLEIFDQVHGAVSGWRQAFAQCRVPKSDEEIIGKDIEERLALA